MTARERWAWQLACHVAVQRSGDDPAPVPTADVVAELCELGCSLTEAEKAASWLVAAGPFEAAGDWTSPAVRAYPGFSDLLAHPGPPPAE